MKPLIIPIFIPHAGCPKRCIFCNQKEVTSENVIPGPEIVDSHLKLYMDSLKKRNNKSPKKRIKPFPENKNAIRVKIGIPAFTENISEIAFFGGSFTGLDLEMQKNFLNISQKWISRGIIKGIRISTRPDFLDEQTINFLKEKKVQTVEIGAQSFSDRVLKISGRGHSAESIEKAAKLISDAGLRLGIQLMMGLPGETENTFLQGVRQAISLNPDFIRIYPVVIFHETELMEMFINGKYKPLTLEETIQIGSKALKMLYDNNIPCIRFGLPEDSSASPLERIGPFHPAMKHMVDSRLAYATMYSEILIRKNNLREKITFSVPPEELSAFKGIRKENIKKIESCFNLICEILPQNQV